MDKTKQQLGVLTHHEMGEDNRLLTGFRQGIETGHRQLHLITHPMSFQQHLRRLLFQNDASETSDHLDFPLRVRLLLLMVMLIT